MTRKSERALEGPKTLLKSGCVEVVGGGEGVDELVFVSVYEVETNTTDCGRRRRRRRRRRMRRRRRGSCLHFISKDSISAHCL
jgi:hypothetical protein